MRARLPGGAGAGAPEDEMLEAFPRARRAPWRRRWTGREHVVLWFEHDLYDQLQLLQVLDAIPGRPPGATWRLILVGVVPGPPGVRRPRRALPLPELAEPVAAAHTPAARAAGPGSARVGTLPRGDLDGLADEAGAADDGLPHLGPALARLLQEVPGPDGLGRTERELLAAVASGAHTAGEAFVEAAAREEAPFLGDGSAFARMEALAAAPHPLLEAGGERIGPTTPVRITDRGRAVLAGEAAHAPPAESERWLGGARLLVTSSKTGAKRRNLQRGPVYVVSTAAVCPGSRMRTPPRA